MAAAGRAAAFLALWVVLIGPDPVDVAAGVVPALAAAWASLRLLPQGRGGVRLVALPGYALRFLRQSVGAGWDVARRAFAPVPRLQPGLASYATGLPAGPARETFASVTSLLPGTVPVGGEGARLEYHCLDAAQPVAAQLADEERAFARLVRVESRDG